MKHSLHQVPEGSFANKVEVSLVQEDRPCLRIALDVASRAGKPGVDFVDQPSFLLMPEVMEDGLIEVDLCGDLRPDAPDYARGFIGLAYRVQADLSAYESIYLRPTNGPAAPPRATRAVQYYAYPDHPFDVLRETEPDRYEAAADIAPGRWSRLSVALQGKRFTAHVDGVLVLQGEGKLPERPGRVGLWVDIGTEGLFANLTLQPK
jgi:hypothetical protein